MKLFIKELKGNEIEINVSEDTKISELKEEIEKQLHIPINQQKILFCGKILR